MQIFHSQKPGERVRVWLDEDTIETMDGDKTVYRLKVQVKDDQNPVHDPSPVFQMALVDLKLVEFQAPHRDIPHQRVTAESISARYCIGKQEGLHGVMAYHVHDHIARPVGTPEGYPASEVEVVLDECGTPITSMMCGPDLTPSEIVEELWLKYADMVHFNETGRIAWREPFIPRRFAPADPNNLTGAVPGLRAVLDAIDTAAAKSLGDITEVQVSFGGGDPK